jgi:hypothetical protein
MADLDPVLVAADVATNLHRPADDPVVGRAVAAAIEYVATYTGLADLEPPGPVPGDALTFNGMVGFATRLYLDQYAPNGAQSAVGDNTFEPIFTPEDIYRHWHHYFDRLTVSWGVA